MGMQLGLVTQTFTASEDQSWLGSAHGTNAADPITLNAASFVSAFPTGIIPSGVVLGKITATGRYAPYIDGNSDGTQTAVGHLLTTVDLTNGGLLPASANWANASAALFSHGQVVEAKLPTGHGLDAAGKVDLKLIQYV